MSRASIRVPTSSGQQFLGPDFAEETGNKFKHHSFLIYAVLIVTAISFVGFIISTVTLFNEQAHFNNQTYKEAAEAASKKVDELSTRITNLNSQVNSLSKELDAIKTK